MLQVVTTMTLISKNPNKITRPFSFTSRHFTSLSAHINELKTLLTQVNTKFDIICILECRISKKNYLATNIDIPGYNIKQAPTESSAGGLVTNKNYYAKFNKTSYS